MIPTAKEISGDIGAGFLRVSGPLVYQKEQQRDLKFSFLQLDYDSSYSLFYVISNENPFYE